MVSPWDGPRSKPRSTSPARRPVRQRWFPGSLLAAACDAEAKVVVKKLPLGPPVSTNAVGMLAGTLILLALSSFYRESWSLPDDPTTWWAWAYLVAFGSVVLFVLFLWTIKRWTASGMSFMFVLMPLVATVLGMLILDEPVTAAAAAGGVEVLLGVYIGALSGGSRPGTADGRKILEAVQKRKEGHAGQLRPRDHHPG